ncbi:MAG TPA: YggS family pyridoxal phosphate-dependent enzyme [Jatrophihabitans sp.]|nr:YggS family pyridoxal phosphate-dependent enzyme [Jatrophihabitans sp.]
MNNPDAHRNDDPRQAELRQAELLQNVAAVRDRIEQACAAAGRDPADLTLIAVTKFFPVTDAIGLARCGITDLGENRDQEAAAKAIAFSEQAPAGTPSVRWHFIGRLQTNKARSVVRYADLVHSVDRPELADALANAAEQAGRRLPVLVQLSLDADPDRGGSTGRQLVELADRVAGRPSLQLSGVMAIPPVEADPDVAFEVLAGLSEQLRAEHPEAVIVSAGMSADLEAAVRHGATHLRIGTALLGRRRQ